MSAEEIILIHNQVFTQILLDEFKKQRKHGAKLESDFLIDKYTIDRLVAERVRLILTEKE